MPVERAQRDTVVKMARDLLLFIGDTAQENHSWFRIGT